MYTYEVRLVKARCLHGKTFKVDVIVRMYKPSPPSQLAMFVRDNSQS